MDTNFILFFNHQWSLFATACGFLSLQKMTLDACHNLCLSVGVVHLLGAPSGDPVGTVGRHWGKTPTGIVTHDEAARPGLTGDGQMRLKRRAMKTMGRGNKATMMRK